MMLIVGPVIEHTLTAMMDLDSAIPELFWILWVDLLSIGTILPIVLKRRPTMLSLDRAFWTMRLLKSLKTLLLLYHFLSLLP